MKHGLSFAQCVEGDWQMNDLISRADVEQTVEDNILCYTHSDRLIDKDPDTECHMAIRTALRMLRKDLRKLPSAHPDSCDGCEWEYAFGYGECHHCKRAYNDMYEVKDEG